jgi:hypothetical protein
MAAREVRADERRAIKANPKRKRPAGLVVFMALRALPNAVVNFFVDFLPDRALGARTRRGAGLERVRAVEDGDAEVGFLPAPPHLCAHGLFAVIPDAEFSALEGK